MSLSTDQTSSPPSGASPASASLNETVISPDPGVRFFQSLRDLWAYRDLFIAFVARDIKVRYRQTALGVIWVVLQPLMTGGLLAILFKSAGIMGDIGALAMGAALAIIAVIVRQEIAFMIMGGVFVMETVSVILQVASFKLTGRRIFRMAPIHHHFELKGWPEPRVIVRFWIISVILVFIGLSTLKIR